MINVLQAKLKNIPTKPGVYQFKDKDGNIIYIGKAKNLQDPGFDLISKRINTRRLKINR